MAPDAMYRTRFLTTPEFWGMYYSMTLTAENGDSKHLMDPLFGVSSERVNRLHKNSFSVVEPPWPFIELRVTEGYGIRIEFGDDGERYILRSSQAGPLLLGQTGAAALLPAFRWTEIERIARFLRANGHASTHTSTWLLLLFPATFLSSQDDVSSVRLTLVSAWRHLGLARDADVGTLVDRTIAATPSTVRWHDDPDLGWVNDAEYSKRNPLAPVKPYSLDQFQLIRSFFRSIAE